MVTSGVVFYAFFGLGWLLAGLGHFGGLVTGVAGTLGLVLALALVRIARQQAAQLADQESEPLLPAKRRRFAQVNAVQWSLIVAAAVGCSAGRVPELTLPLVAIVVGLHFLPLARVFDDARLITPGVVLAALGVAGLLAWAADASRGTVYTLVGVGCAVTLWSTALWSLVGIRRAAAEESA
ncbi:hypothetical protein ACFW1A_17865 [Kitasatospora sp. NPDC058965]|uniref:hypothetical protein n=1 Tax=Kitasatospora sp. NPDC058965 TaxID=3346682 RepID=UPI0036BA6AB2